MVDRCMAVAGTAAGQGVTNHIMNHDQPVGSVSKDFRLTRLVCVPQQMYKVYPEIMAVHTCEKTTPFFPSFKPVRTMEGDEMTTGRFHTHAKLRCDEDDNDNRHNNINIDQDPLSAALS